jgi:hypothetical protein
MTGLIIDVCPWKHWWKGKYIRIVWIPLKGTNFKRTVYSHSLKHKNRTVNLHDLLEMQRASEQSHDTHGYRLVLPSAIQATLLDKHAVQRYTLTAGDQHREKHKKNLFVRFSSWVKLYNMRRTDVCNCRKHSKNELMFYQGEHSCV